MIGGENHNLNVRSSYIVSRFPTDMLIFKIRENENFVLLVEAYHNMVTREDVIVENRDITIWMNVDGQVMLNRDYVELSTLRVELSRLAKQDIDQLVIIKADVGVTHGRVVTVMDMVREFGFTRMAIATDSEGSTDPTKDDPRTP